jgi:hypothetical protein
MYRALVQGLHADARAGRRQGLHRVVKMQLHAFALRGCGQAHGVLVDIAGAVVRCVEATYQLAADGRFNGPHLSGAHRVPHDAAAQQQLGDVLPMRKARSVAVDMQNAARTQVKADSFRLGPGKQVFAGFERKPRRGDGVGFVMRDARDKLSQPTELVPGRLRVYQQRRILAQHPLDAIEDGGGAVPHFGVAGRYLSRIGKRGFHRRIPVPLVQSDRETPQGQRIGCGDPGDAAPDNRNCLNHVTTSTAR